ncbi:MAG: hypothetical protein NTZ60_01840 [Campylobacterales bacterium]|nr:hypothetical protein [Campylobacterales bacterium]
MKNKYLYIIDIRFKQKREFNLLNYNICKDSEIIALTPYSSYLLDSIDKKYDTFHDIIPIKEFRDNIIYECEKIEKLITDYKSFSYLFYYLVLIKTKQHYYKIVLNYIQKKKADKYNIVYISDTKAINKDMNNYDFMSNNINLISLFEEVSNSIHIREKDNLFYFKQKIKILFSKIKHTTKILIKIKMLLFSEKNQLNIYYDNVHFRSFFYKKEAKEVTYKKIDEEYEDFKQCFLDLVKEENFNSIINKMYDSFFSSLKNVLDTVPQKQILKIQPFVFLSNNQEFIRTIIYEQNNISKVFMQHGSYIHENITLKYCEIYPADINFVFNDYTSELFKKREAKNVEVVGTVNFNKQYQDSKILYDYVYIAYCSSYAYPGTFIGMSGSTISMDGMSIYNRHKNIIELFGKMFTSKKLCIKIQPSMMTSHMYVPFIELSKFYTNITIEFTTPLHSLIENSKYIISDYFSSEFSSREVHYKKDIILFQHSPFPIGEDIKEDMEKMFILCPDEKALIGIIQNIEILTKNRKRYDAIIEYYSSKKCDTVEKATLILEKEFNGR